LNLLAMPLPEHHVLDGVDITPALRGGQLDRKAITTYFPHSPPVPEWLPPAMSVHCGDWKLIRLFYQGENGLHDYRLYDLAHDVGEKNNLASNDPNRVRAMDRLIEDYIQSAQVVVPKPNPRFDAQKYHPERIGIPADRTEKAVRPVPSTAVGAWRSGGTCSIKRARDTLVIESSGSDPYFYRANMTPVSGGPFTVQVRVKSTASGDAMVFYNKPGIERTVPLPVIHDGQWHEYHTDIPVETLTGFRLDPATGAGRITVAWIHVTDQSGATVAQWSF
jgi:hypothetical protein